MATKFEPNAERCTARAKSTGERCQKAALVGLTVCRSHGAATKAAKTKSAVAKAERTMNKYVKPIPLDHELSNPAYGLHYEYRRTVARIEWLDKRIAKLTEEEANWGRTKEERVNATDYPGTNTTFEARLHPRLVLQERERAFLLKLEKVMIDAQFKAAEQAIEQRTSMEVEKRVWAIVKAMGRDPLDPRVKKALGRMLRDDEFLFPSEDMEFRSRALLEAGRRSR
jgi:hypothetical protein